jgi:transcriptional regulator with XRE-family HTH domain
MSTIGQRISELRKNSSFSQEYVAEKLNVSRQAVSKWEQDLSAPDTYNLIALAELFDVSVEYLATGKLREATPPPSPPPSAPPKSGITARQVLGLILVAAGLLGGILGILLEEILIIISIFITVIGVLCIAVKKHFGIFLAWTLLALLFPITFSIMSITPSTGGDSGVMSISIGGIFLILFIGQLVITAVVSIITIIKTKRK